MKFLLTNDDGIDAPGMEALHAALSSFLQKRAMFDCQIIVVAPDRGRSECGHSVTTSRDLNVQPIRPDWYMLDGTPVDCVRVALACICPDAVAVFSGINAGANVGIDLLVSGTFAGAREAAIHEKPAIAISHYRRPEIPKTWDHATRWLAPVWEHFFDQVGLTGEAAMHGETPVRRPVLWNVNLPAIPPTPDVIPPLKYCTVDETLMIRRGQVSDCPLPNEQTSSQVSSVVKLTSEFHNRPRTPGSDVDQCFSGNITISSLEPKLTCRPLTSAE